VFRNWDGVMDRVDVAQDTGRWGTHVNAVMKLGLRPKVKQVCRCTCTRISRRVA
jgi:hypothetical protein